MESITTHAIDEILQQAIAEMVPARTGGTIDVWLFFVLLGALTALAVVVCVYCYKQGYAHGQNSANQQ